MGGEYRDQMIGQHRAGSVSLRPAASERLGLSAAPGSGFHRAGEQRHAQLAVTLSGEPVHDLGPHAGQGVDALGSVGGGGQGQKYRCEGARRGGERFQVGVEPGAVSVKSLSCRDGVVGVAPAFRVGGHLRSSTSPGRPIVKRQRLLRPAPCAMH